MICLSIALALVLKSNIFFGKSVLCLLSAKGGQARVYRPPPNKYLIYTHTGFDVSPSWIYMATTSSLLPRVFFYVSRPWFMLLSAVWYHEYWGNIWCWGWTPPWALGCIPSAPGWGPSGGLMSCWWTLCHWLTGGLAEDRWG